MPESKHALGSAIAGGAIATALIEILFDKGVLTLGEGRRVLELAMATVGAHSQADGAMEAMRIIADLQRGRFNARGTTP